LQTLPPTKSRAHLVHVLEIMDQRIQGGVVHITHCLLVFVREDIEGTTPKPIAPLAIPRRTGVGASGG